MYLDSIMYLDKAKMYYIFLIYNYNIQCKNIYNGENLIPH